MEPTPPNPEPSAGETRRFHWPLFIALLLSPAALALLSSMGKLDALAIALPFIGGGVMAVFSGITFGRRFGKTVATKVFAGIAFALLFGFVTFGLGFVGCLAGGFKMDMR